MRNQGTNMNPKTAMKVLRDSCLSLPPSKHKGRTKPMKLFKPAKPDPLWETDITYIHTELRMSCLMRIKDTFTNA